MQGCFKVASKLLVMRKFSGFLPKAATTLERPWRIMRFFTKVFALPGGGLHIGAPLVVGA
jgi:hypothetical protein